MATMYGPTAVPGENDGESTMETSSRAFLQLQDWPRSPCRIAHGRGSQAIRADKPTRADK